ncbi:peptidylprolyl isomerase [Aliiroseovarius subalbicans]|uniref:peptidylprolyl isomerase n=1 Tax=Aliiroseovarius subalbicans TaxID=2925840 RepID=UPI001F5A0DB2|nr:peptidylprolyl isomerase [Aliiroseovarius subalbicans]MCI2398161.1 peptidylprolyl isomerase [Aliiroseovarius subalbicans]
MTDRPERQMDQKMTNTLSFFLTRILTIVAALSMGAMTLPATAQQGLFDPVAKVNDRVITAYELSQRMAFMTLLKAPGDLRELAMTQLVDERLQLDAARLAEIRLTGEQVQVGMEEFASRANLTTEKFIAAIAQGGIAAETFRDFVSAGLLWREVARARFVNRVQISEAEIDRAIALTQPGAGVRVLMSEIILPANTPASQQASQARAEQLSKIDTLPAFASAARRYSAAPSKGRSGRLEWIELSNLPAAVAAQILPLSPGQVTDPIPVRNGIALFQLRAIEETDTPAAEDVSLDYAQFFLPGGHTQATLSEADKITARVDTCDDLYGVAKGLPEERLSRDVLPIADVPTDIALELAKLDDGEASTALTRNEGQTLVYLMLCGRTRALPEEVSREDVTNQLRNQRLAAFAASYLQELKADAFIEYFDAQ